MKPFSRDILLVDFEVTGFDTEKDEAVQIGVMLLDKETLEKKWSYSSWIKPAQEITYDMPGFRWANFNEDDLKKIDSAPTLEKVAREIADKIPDNYILCAWNATFDHFFWTVLMKSIGKTAKLGRILDLWTLAQGNLLKDENYMGDDKSESVFQYFGAKPRVRHDGITDCEIEAMLLRKLMA